MRSMIISLNNYTYKYKFPTMLDKSWNKFEDYQQDILDALSLMENELMFLLCEVNTYFNEMERGLISGEIYEELNLPLKVLS